MQAPPGSESANGIAQPVAVGGIGVFSVESGDANWPAGTKRRLQKFVRVGDVIHPAHGVSQRDQGMRLAAAELCIQPKDCAGLLRLAENARRHQLEYIFQALGRISVGEERDGIFVFFRAVSTKHLRKIGGEVALRQRPLKHVLTWLTDGEKVVVHGDSDCRWGK